ncbi:MAG: fumarylacetoacetate hydrolase family protein [Actinomycetota bacterium]|nr:fumarylacetoacetate hydrolase family protein [Actinomycetota bacterium]
MKIVRFSDGKNDPRFGILEDEEKIRVIASDPLYAGIHPIDEQVLLKDVRLLAPVIPRSKVVCIGKNYADHAAEMKSEVPDEPIIFIKPNTSVIGPNDLIQWPKESRRVDHEAELAIVISKICRSVPQDKVNDVIFGYTLANDVTARDLQKVDGQWTRAKGFDTFCPIGPWIETEFIPQDQKIRCRVDGQEKQSGKLSDMVFKIPKLIEFVTSVMTLLPGDLILTGTPAGVGPLMPGKTVEVEIDGLGILVNRCSERALD